MTQFLPPNLLALFAPRDPIRYLPPTEKLPFEKKTRGYSGVASYISLFEDPKDTPPPVKVESREEKITRKKREKAEMAAYKLEQGIALWDPKNISSASKDPFKTIFVGRLNFDTSESKLKREFEVYGPIKKVIMVHNKVTGKPRGYAFIEYEHEKDMHVAYKHGDGKKIDGRRVIVDVERGRTVSGWLPRRLGGGLGGRRGQTAPREDREERERSRGARGKSEDDSRIRRRESRERENNGRSHERRDREDRHRDRGDRHSGRDRERKRRTRSRSGSREKERSRRTERDRSETDRGSRGAREFRTSRNEGWE